MSRALDRAIAALEAGQAVLAETELRALLRAKPGQAQAHHLYGVAALLRNDATEALKRLERAEQLAPQAAVVHQSLAEAHLRLHDLARAESHATRARDLAPQLAEPWNVLGLVLLEQRRYESAIAALRTAIELKRGYPEAMLNLAVACNRTGEHELAITLSELLLQNSPRHTGALINLGMAYKGLRQLPQARAAFTSAGDHPMARFNLGHVLLLEDDLERGLPLYEQRLQVTAPDDALGVRWDGNPAHGLTLLVQHEQGLGDVLLMSRFLAPLCDRFAQVLVHAPAPLASLLAKLDSRLRVVTSLAGQQWDLWCPMMSLPYALGIRSVAELPLAPWIRVAAPAQCGTRPRVGLNWAGNPNYTYDYMRSTSLCTLAPLLAIKEVQFVSLHRGTREHEAHEQGLAQPLLQAPDFLATAQVLTQLDMVISTETAIPNLSAAMGIPTVVLTVKDVDWRWRSWYAGVTIAAQERKGDWGAPIAVAADAVARLRELRAAA